MKGVVLAFNEDTTDGIISAEDGHRSSFAGIISREGIAGLIEHLRQKNIEQAGKSAS